MRKYLLFVVVSAFIFGCMEGATPAPDADWLKDLDKYQGQCAEIAFADAKAKLLEADQLKSSGKAVEAGKAISEAKQLFDDNVGRYNDLKGASDRAASEMQAQQSRLSNIESDARAYAPEEYTDVKLRTDAKYTEIAAKIEACDGEGALADLEDTKVDVKYIEDLVELRRGTKVVATGDDEIYTVKRGDSLWRIAANKYSNPKFWPLIYWANQSSIKDPDLIYPNQQLKIDQNASSQQKADAEKLSSKRGTWSLYDRK